MPKRFGTTGRAGLAKDNAHPAAAAAAAFRGLARSCDLAPRATNQGRVINAGPSGAAA